MEIKVNLFYIVQPGSGHVAPVGTIIPCPAFSDVNLSKMGRLHPKFTIAECIKYFCEMNDVDPSNYIVKYAM